MVSAVVLADKGLSVFMSETSDTRRPGRSATLGTIFLSVLTVAGVVLSGLIDSPSKGMALAATGLAFAAVVSRFLKIWSGRLDRQLIALLVAFIVPFGWLLALLIPSSNGNQSTFTDSNRSQMEERIAELERENAALRVQISPTTISATSNTANTTTTSGSGKATTTRPANDTDYSLTMRYEWGADLDTGKPVRPQDAEGSDLYNDGTITGRYNKLIAFSHTPSGDECKDAIRQDSGSWVYQFSDVTEGTNFCLLTDKERIAILRVSRLGHEAQSDSDYVVFYITLLK
jgi:hypothetical protein